jgi:hypothetical protein
VPLLFPIVLFYAKTLDVLAYKSNTRLTSHYTPCVGNMLEIGDLLTYLLTGYGDTF